MGPSGDRHDSGDPGVTLAIAPGITLAICAPRRTLTLAIHTVAMKTPHTRALGFEIVVFGINNPFKGV